MAPNATVPLEVFLDEDIEFLKEFWALFILGILIIVARFPVRIRMVGLHGLTKDDYMSVLTLAAWTGCMTMVEQVHVSGTNVDVTQEQIDVLSDADIDRLIHGSKCQEAAWYLYTALLWSMKFTILLFYKRLIGYLWNPKVFIGLAWFTGACYCAVVFTICFTCLPFESNWQVNPLPSFECTFKMRNLVVTTSLNILTDTLILILPLPLFRELNIHPVKKTFVIVLLCSGLFVIAAAIMRLVNTLDGSPSTVTVNRWGVRECTVGVAAINAPVLRPIFSYSFWCGKKIRHSGPAQEDRLAHPPGMSQQLRRRGWRKDTILGWLKTTGKYLSTVSTATWTRQNVTVAPRYRDQTLDGSNVLSPTTMKSTHMNVSTLARDDDKRVDTLV